MFRSDKNRTGIRLAVGLAAMLATTAQASDCQSLLRDRASLTLALDDIRDEYPKLTQALDYCEDQATRKGDLVEQAAIYSMCVTAHAGPQCLMIGMDTCDAVFERWKRIKKSLTDVEVRLNEAGC